MRSDTSRAEASPFVAADLKVRIYVVVVALAAAAGLLAAQSSPGDRLARDIYRELIETNTTDTPAGDVTAAANAMAARLVAAGFPAADVQVLAPADKPRKGNLVARFRGTGTRRPILFLAHLDVVEARREDWSVDPFTLTERGGFFYGRGTSDDKAMAAQFVATFIRLRQERFTTDRDLILALTADEEGGTANGVQWLLANHRPLIDAEFAINEGGGGSSRGGRYLAMEVQASEKVYQDYRLEVVHEGGHSSLPVADNAIYHLAEALSRLSRLTFPVQLNEVTRSYFERTAMVEADAGLAADLRAVARPDPDPNAAARLSARQPLYNALMRTTCVATRVDAGHANNALPQTAVAIVNCRLLPGTSPTDVRDILTRQVANPRVAITFIGDATPSAPSVLNPEVMTTVETLTREMFPGVPVMPIMGTGATDGLYLRNAGIPTYGVSGMFFDLDDVRAHGRDERVGVRQFYEGLEFQYRLTKALVARSR